MKNFFQRIQLIIFSILFLFLFLEVLLRIFHPVQEPMRWFESSENYGYTHKKNFSQNYLYSNSKENFIMNVKTNSYGHRYYEYDKNKLSDSNYKKIMLLGDSFIFGHGINMNEHITSYLDSLLDTNYVIINAGIGGWGTLQETKYAINHFNKFNPDVIALFYCNNDPIDDIKFKNNMLNNIKGIFYFPGKIFLRNNSHLYRFLVTKFKILLNQIIINKNTKEKVSILNKNNQSLITKENWNNTLKYIKKFQKKFVDFNSKGILLIGASSPWDINIKKKLSSLENGKSIYYLDLYKETINLENSKRRLPHDGHWNPIIHKLFALKLFKKIKLID